MTRGLDDVVVLELGSAPSGQYCAYLLAGLGAGITTVATPGAAEPAEPQGADWLRQLAEVADVVVDSRPADRPDGPGAEQLRSWNPRLVLARITWFGLSGPQAGIRASELTCSATSGYLHMNGLADREPLKLFGVQGQRHAGLQAAIAVLGALRVRDRTGQGALLDLSVQEAMVYLTAGATLDFFHTGTIRRRSGNSQAASTRGQTYTSILPCADGFLLLGIVGGRDFGRLEQLMETTLASEDSHLRQFPGAHEAEVSEICGAWLATRKREEVLARAVACGLHWALVNSIPEVIASEQVQARGFLIGAQQGGHDVVLPGRPVVFSRIPWTHGQPQGAPRTA